MPGPEDGGGDAAYLGQFFTSVRAVATLSNPYGLHNQEWHGHVSLLHRPAPPLGPDVAAATPVLQLTRQAPTRPGMPGPRPGRPQ